MPKRKQDNPHEKNIIIQNIQNNPITDSFTSRKIQKKDWTLTLILSIFFGWFGLDRFYMGHIGLGILKLITAGGWGIWWIIDVILIATKHNFAYVRWEETKIDKVKKENLFRKHWILTTLIILLVFFFGLMIIGAFISETEKDSHNKGNLALTDNSNTPDTQTTTPTQITPTVSKTWNKVDSFSGKSSKKTDTFYITGDKFKVIYAVNPENDYSLFYLTIYKEGQNMYTDMVSLDSGSDESIIYKGKGNFYLDINAANLNSWKVEIEDYY